MKTVLTEQHLNAIVKDAVSLMLEARYAGTICRFPYPVNLALGSHAIERGYERLIREDDLLDAVSKVFGQIQEDYNNGELKPYTECFKVVNRDSCLVCVCHLELIDGSTKIRRVVVRTSYIWDGKMNYQNSRNEKIYYMNEPSEEFIEASQWNAEHQDLVGDYTRWKHGIDVKKRDELADYMYDVRETPFTHDDTNASLRMHRVKKGMEQERLKNIHRMNGEFDPEDFAAMRDYDAKMDYVPLASKGSANRDLRAMDLRKQRKDIERQRKYYGDKVNDVSDEDLLKYPKAVGKINLTDRYMETYTRNQRKRK